ncbi:MAG: DUF3667 domain-containing protein [bacterium]|nr:DUF3667 domain-containing protein [bacterium]
MEPEPGTSDATDRPPRLTLRIVAREVVERVFSLERGWLRTARELSTEPGAMIRRYVEDRRGYTNPFAYLLTATALSVVLQMVTGFQGKVIEQMESVAGPTTGPGQAAFVQNVSELVYQNLIYVSLSVLIPLALLLRLLFRRAGFNLAEVLVFALYAGGHAALIGIVLMLVHWIVRAPLTLQGTLGTILAIAYIAYAAVGFFGGRLATIGKAVVAYAVSFGFCMLAAMIAGVAYALIVMPPELVGGDSWDLLSAAEGNVVQVVEELLDEGADVNLTLRRTPLHVASDKGHTEIVDLLLAHGADLNAQDHLGRVPLFLALNRGHREIARRLADAGTDATARTHRGETLLMIAVRRKDADLAEWLLEHGADVNAACADRRGRATALMIAAAAGDPAMVEMLLGHGADPGVANDQGETALDLSRSEAVAARLRESAGAR